MAEIPGLEDEVFFDDAEKPLPNWRETLSIDEEDTDEISSEDRAAVVKMLGFDPNEFAEQEEDENEQIENQSEQKIKSPSLPPSKLKRLT